MFGKIYLDVPYQEKDEAKKLGARFDGSIKKWYYEGYISNYVKFGKWILKDKYEVRIASEYIYVLEGVRKCWKCKKSTRVIALGISDNINIYLKDNGTYGFEEIYDGVHRAWVDKEDDIPFALLQYLKKNYSVKTGYSNTVGKCFANHCDYCGAIQGNNYVMYESDSPLSTSIYEPKLEERISKVKVKQIPIDPDLALNWNIVWGSNDYAYLTYGQVQEVILAKTRECDEYITYKEMYNL